LFILIAVFLGVYLKWNAFETVIFCIFICTILHPLPSRFLAMPAFFFLILTAFFLVFKQEIIAEQLAIYCYYFLVMTVIAGVYETRKEEKEKNRKISG